MRVGVVALAMTSTCFLASHIAPLLHCLLDAIDDGDGQMLY